MSSFRATIDPRSRAKAWAAVAAVHVTLAAIIVSGLSVEVVRHAVEKMTTINIVEPAPPPPKPPPPAPQPEKAKLEEGAAAKKAEPSPIVAPKPRIPTPSPLPAAPVAGTGSAATSGAASAGTGTGAGGSGQGRGGGGSGNTSGFTPARLVRNLSRGDYRSLTGGLMPAGSADVAISIAADGAVSGCQVIRSSGNSRIDSGLCPVVVRRLRFRPARDASGKAIPYRTNFHARWSLNS